MDIEFDPDKDAINRDKHGASLALAAELTDIVDGVRYCAAVTLRGEAVRIISLRRAHRKEFRRHG